MSASINSIEYTTFKYKHIGSSQPDARVGDYVDQWLG